MPEMMKKMDKGEVEDLLLCFFFTQKNIVFSVVVQQKSFIDLMKAISEYDPVNISCEVAPL